MDGRNRALRPPLIKTAYIRMPTELWYLVFLYRDSGRFTSLSGAVRSLLETHPALVILAEQAYNEPMASKQPQETLS